MTTQLPVQGAAHATPASPTAGFLNTDWNPRTLPPGATTRNVVLRTTDGAATMGALYTPAGPTDVVVCIMHPREFMACHYLIPDILEAGFAAWTQTPRSVGNDVRLEHEVALSDVACGQRWLRDNGFGKVVLLGNSGGAGLYGLYGEQAALPPASRIAKTPGGRPTGLATLDMPTVDAFIFVGPHPGQGALLMACIDPSVADEADPLSTVPDLDPLDPANGYGSKDGTRYSSAFIERYRAAQRERVARIDARARELIQRRQAARRRVKEAGDGATPEDRRLAGHTPIIEVWRTDADLRCLDLSLDPSDRKLGSLWGSDPYGSNYGALGFGRICSPESWLSTWSGLSSNAGLLRTAPALKAPTLVIEYTGDQACFPSDVQAIFKTLGADDKLHLRLRGDHHGRPLSASEPPGRLAAGSAIGRWLKQQFTYTREASHVQ